MAKYTGEQLRKMDAASLWHPYTKHSSMTEASFPIIERGEGLYLYDIEGNRFLDGISSWWCCNLGHSHPELVDSIKRQAAVLQHSILGNLTHPYAIELAARLVNLFPTSDRRVLFAGDGASAVEAALKVAVQYWYAVGKPERSKFVSLVNDYHGDTLGAVSVGFVESFHKQFAGVVSPSFQAESPCCKACGWGKTEETCNLECFASMQSIFNAHAEELAAVIVEPLCQGASGMRIYTSKYLAALGNLCREHDVLLISDEIAMGYGRTGKMFAFEHAGIDPDIVCCGKGMSGGYLPISATVVKKRVYDAFTDYPEDNTFYHGHTFAGNPIASAVGVTVLDIYERESIVAQAQEKGAVLAREMARFAALDCVDNVRCLGMIAAVELHEQSLQPNYAGRTHPEAIKRELLANSILVRPLGRVVYIMPPLIIPENLLCETVRCLYDAIKKTAENQ